MIVIIGSKLYTSLCSSGSSLPVSAFLTGIIVPCPKSAMLWIKPLTASRLPGQFPKLLFWLKKVVNFHKYCPNTLRLHIYLEACHTVRFPPYTVAQTVRLNVQWPKQPYLSSSECKASENFILCSHGPQKLSKYPSFTPTLLCVWGSLIFSPMSRSWTSEREVRRNSSRLDRVRWTGQDEGGREGKREEVGWGDGKKVKG